MLLQAVGNRILSWYKVACVVRIRLCKDTSEDEGCRNICPGPTQLDHVISTNQHSFIK